MYLISSDYLDIFVSLFSTDNVQLEKIHIREYILGIYNKKHQHAYDVTFSFCIKQCNDILFSSSQVTSPHWIDHLWRHQSRLDQCPAVSTRSPSTPFCPLDMLWWRHQHVYDVTDTSMTSQDVWPEDGDDHSWPVTRTHVTLLTSTHRLVRSRTGVLFWHTDCCWCVNWWRHLDGLIDWFIHWFIDWLSLISGLFALNEIKDYIYCFWKWHLHEPGLNKRIREFLESTKTCFWTKYVVCEQWR